MKMIYTRGSLSFVANEDGGYVCRELQSLLETFIKACSGNDEIEKDIESHIDGMRHRFEIRYDTRAEHDKVSEMERRQLGIKKFDALLPAIRKQTKKMNPLEQFLFWMGSWWYYDSKIRQNLYLYDKNWVHENISKMVKKHIVPLLPDQVRSNLVNADPRSVAVGFGHFAILFVFENGTRRIVTDTQLFELNDVHGYTYLDITPDGKPIARSACNGGGGRAFFDGVRLMRHRKFQTCAPKTAIVKGGYKVNSTECTIVSGMLFELIDVDDKVAYTTGAFMGDCDFSNAEAVASYKMAEESAGQMLVKNGDVIFNNETLLPFGIFLPSRVKLLENGFALYDWSDFEKISGVRYSSVLAIDDKQEWLDRVVEKFGGRIKNLKVHLTSDKCDALSVITTMNPSVVLLDMHLTPEEEFEGLWIARTLAKEDFKGKVMIASGYPEIYLKAMRTLINAPLHIPGKNLDRVEKCLTNECDCLS